MALAALMSGFGCATARPTAVSPVEIPTLEAQLGADPDNGEVRHRYAAALFSADRCEDAVAQAERAMETAPTNVVGALVVGRCLEADARYDEALGVYAAFQSEHPRASGVEAVEGQRRLAEQQRAVRVARAAVAADRAGEPGPADPQAVAVLPLLIAGDSAYQSLSRGLASIILSDLDLLQRFRLLERLELNAIMNELALGQSGAVDAETAARVGRIVRAGRTVQGTADVSVEEQTRLIAAVVTDVGGDPATVQVEGRLEDLLDMEKQLVFGIAEALGYPPSLAERRRIEQNGTQSIAAFLAFSRGLEAGDVGDYGAAMLHFRDAVTEDPGFTQAGGELEVAAAAEVVSTATGGQVTQLPAETRDAVDRASGQASDLGSAVASSITDVASLGAEQITQSAGLPETSLLINRLIGLPGPTFRRVGALRITIVIPGS